MTVVAFAPRPHPTANQPKKDLYEIGEIPPLGHVPKNMYAWVIRRERHGPPEQSMQLEVVPTHTIGEDEVLVESTTGGLNALRENGTARRLFDQSAASPFFDGRRIYFLVGAITGGADGTPILVNNPSVWSVAVDGKDARREDRLGLGGNVRLDGRWPDGRYLVHVGSDATQYLSGNGLVSLQGSTVLRRVVVSADRRAAVGFSGVRLIRIDLSKGPIPPENAFVVLLDGIVGADAWVPRGPAL